MTHLRKGLAAAETVNLHLVEAGDLHGGAEEQRPLCQSWSLSPRCTPPRRAAVALADDALPGAGNALVPGKA